MSPAPCSGTIVLILPLSQPKPETTSLHALSNCSNTNSSPDGLSFRLLRTIRGSVLSPLLLIFQHSILEGIFLQLWKRAVITPLYKGRSKRNKPTSYRPIYLSSCFGKVLEKVVLIHLNAYQHDNDLPHNAQHGITSGRSTLSNMLVIDTHIAQLAASCHAVDHKSFDFAKAFNKLPHLAVIETLADHGISGTSTVDVVSGIMHGSVAGPSLYTVLIDLLL